MTAAVRIVRHTTHPGPERPGPGHPSRRRPRQRPSDLSPQEQTAAAARLIRFLGRWYVDAQAGRVEVRQLRSLLTPTAEHRVMAAVLRARHRHRRGGWSPGTRLTVRRVMVSPRSEHFETLALVDDGVRTVPVVAVLHATDRGWRISDLARPDDGLPALAAPLLREPPAPYDHD